MPGHAAKWQRRFSRLPRSQDRRERALKTPKYKLIFLSGEHCLLISCCRYAVPHRRLPLEAGGGRRARGVSTPLMEAGKGLVENSGSVSHVLKRRFLQELSPDMVLSDSSLVAVRDPLSQERGEISLTIRMSV